MKKTTYSIGDTARKTGCTRKQIRSWEAKGYIQKADRIVCGDISYRVFSLKQVEMISRIKDFLDEGYTLSAAAKKAKTSNLNQRKESTPGDSFK